jgi:hypothetical protein
VAAPADHAALGRHLVCAGAEVVSLDLVALPGQSFTTEAQRHEETRAKRNSARNAAGNLLTSAVNPDPTKTT